MDLSGAFSSLAKDLPSPDALVQQILMGAAANTVLTGLKNGGADSIDFLGIFHKKDSGGSNQPPPPVVTHPTVSAAVWATLNDAQKAQLLAAGVNII